jgi:peptidyl-prolyl cis-trans isomerase C
MRYRPVIFILALLFLSTGCDVLKFNKPKSAAQEKPSVAAAMPVRGTPVAKVGNITLTLQDLDQEVETYNNMVQAENPELKIVTKEQKINYLKNEMARRALLYQYAMDKGVDKDEEIVKALEKNKMELVVMGLLKEETKNIEVTSKEVEDAYNQYKEQFKEPEERQIREIVVPDEAAAKDILIQLLQGGDFAMLAQTRSTAASAKSGGDLGFIQPGTKFAQFDNVAFAESLEVGKVSNIFNGPDGFYILKLEAKRGGKQRTLSEMWDDIKNMLLFSKQKEKVDKLTGNLSREAKIEVYEGVIK